MLAKHLLFIAFITSTLFVSFLHFTDKAEAGFGISPPWFKNDRLAPGSHYEQDIFLVQGDPKVDIKVDVTLNTEEDIEDWISFKPGKEFIIPAGSQQFPLRVIADVPKDAGYALYKGTIKIVATSLGSSAGDGGGSGVAIRLGSTARVSLNVTSEEFSDFKVQSVQVGDIEEGWPLSIAIKMENLGNIKVRPTKVLLTIYDRWHEKVLLEGEAGTTEWIEPFEKGLVNATMPIDLGVGNYFADFEVFKGDEVVARDKERFLIVESGTINQWPRIFGISIAWIIGGILIIAGLFAFIKFNIFGKLLSKAGIEIKRMK